ncbi:carboxymuconolactone decarboxylase family protein [Sessilibacter sp. MAH2]
MAEFTLYTQETAPEASKPFLDNALKMFGMIPNLAAVLAESPETLECYQMMHVKFQETSFSAEELTVVWMTINVENECHYCVPAHTAIAHMMGVDAAIITALRERTPIPVAKLETLRETTLAIMNTRGCLTDEQFQKFYDAGYGNKQILEILLGLAQKTISNYTNHLAKTPIDEPFAKFA